MRKSILVLLFLFPTLLSAQTLKDRYKRILGVVYLGDTNINAEMIRAGYAWNYKYSKDK